MSETSSTASGSAASVAASTPKAVHSKAGGATKGKGKAKSEVKAEAKSEEGKEGKWPTEDTAKLLFIVMQQDNKELLATGWKKIFEKVHDVFGDKYTDAAVKYVGKDQPQDFILKHCACAFLILAAINRKTEAD